MLGLMRKNNKKYALVFFIILESDSFNDISSEKLKKPNPKIKKNKKNFDTETLIF